MSETWRCTKCQGLYVEDITVSEDVTVVGLRCLNCGQRPLLRQTMLINRDLPPLMKRDRRLTSADELGPELKHVHHVNKGRPRVQKKTATT